MFTHRCLVPSSLPGDTKAVKSGASSKLPNQAVGGVAGTRPTRHEPLASAPTPPSDLLVFSGETDQSATFNTDRVYQFRKSTLENVCG